MKNLSYNYRLKLLCVCFAVSISAIAQSTDYTQGLSIWFDTPPPSEKIGINYTPNSDMIWERYSLPIGNGNIGGNVMGTIATEHITLNEKTLWRGGPNTAKGADYYWNVNKESAKWLPEIRQAFIDGNQEKAEKLTRENFNGYADYVESKENPFRFGSFTSMGEACIETGLSESGISNYKRILSLDSALAIINFNKDGVRYERKYFTSYPDNVMVMKFSADCPGKQNLALSYGSNPEATGTITAIGNDGFVYLGKLKSNQMKFALRIKTIYNGGKIKVEDGKIIVQNANEVIFLLTADTDYLMNFNPDFKDPQTYVGADPESTTRDIINAASVYNYDQLYNHHRTDYSNLFNRVKLNINPDIKSPNNQPTYKRLTNYKKDNQDFQLEILYFQFGRYLLAAASRPGNMATNLQGMWHQAVDGPWHIDYHNNINTQMNYWPACSTNLQECMLPLIDYIRTQIKPGERTAKAYFDARGWTASISANIFGFTAPLTDQDMTWNLNAMAGPWLATQVWEYYDYTRDYSFLKDIGYEIIKGSANFTVDYLWHRPDGTYSAAPSTSPEHGLVDEGTTYAHAVAKEILMSAIDASKVLGIDRQERKQWQKVLDKITPYKIGRYGQLQEWFNDIDDPNDEHRHINHLFGLHPGHSISPHTTPKLAQAAKVVLEHRGDGNSGWSMGWKLNQWARIGDGNHAYKLVRNLITLGTVDNLWNMFSHPPFQIDGNYGGTAGFAEMLLQSHMGVIQVLPALPDAWENGSVQGLCARGNFEIGIEWNNKMLGKITILSRSGGKCHIKYKNSILILSTIKNNKYHVVFKDGILKPVS